MGNKLAATLLATSAEPLDIATGFPTLTTSLKAVGCDKAFTIVDWSSGASALGVTIWKASLKISGRIFIGVAGPAYAVTCSPSMEYTDSAQVSSTYYTWCTEQSVGPIKVKNCAYVSDSKPTSASAFNIVEHQSKHVPRAVTVDSWGSQKVYGGFVMGIWLFLSLETSGKVLKKKWSYNGQTQTNLLYDAIQAGLTIAWLASGNPAGAEAATASLTEKVTGAIKSQSKWTLGSYGVSALTGNVESFFDQASSGLDSKNGVSIDPTCKLNFNLLDFVPYLATGVTALSAVGLTLTVGPYISIHFPIAVTVSALSVNGQSGAVTSYSPVTADVGPTNTASGTPGTVSVADPSVSAPTTVGISLTAVPGVDIEIGFEAGISYGKYFHKGWKVDLSADVTGTLSSLFGTIPASVTNSLSNDVGSTSSGTVKKS